MKSATVVFVSLVALLLLLPVPAAAASSIRVQQAEQIDVTPDVTPAVETEEESSITNLHATAGRLRGRVELAWNFSDEAAAGVFVVERSTNGSSWRPVKACSTPISAEQNSYACLDTRLISGTTYSYRVCVAAKATTCSNVLTTEPVTVKAP